MSFFVWVIKLLTLWPSSVSSADASASGVGNVWNPQYSRAPFDLQWFGQPWRARLRNPLIQRSTGSRKKKAKQPPAWSFLSIFVNLGKVSTWLWTTSDDARSCTMFFTAVPPVLPMCMKWKVLHSAIFCARAGLGKYRGHALYYAVRDCNVTLISRYEI